MTPAQLASAVLAGTTFSVGFALAPRHDPTPPPARATISAEAARTAFGRAVAIAGDFAFVSEPNVGGGGRGGRGANAPIAPGTVYVYRYAVATGWKEAGKLAASSPSEADGFGSALAAQGTTLLVGQVRPSPVGAPAGRGQPPNPAPPDTAVGSVQVFTRGADMEWTAGAALAASPKQGAKFGAALAIAGDLALVGAPLDATGGAVYTFARGKDGSWTLSGTLAAQNLAANDRFGSAIAIDGNRIAIGAPGRNNKGAVFIFERDSSGAWVQKSEQLAPRNFPDNALFGNAVAVKGDRVIAGAPGVNFSPPQVPGAGRGGPPATPGGANVPLGAGLVIIYERASFGSWRNIGTLAPFDFGNAAFGTALGVAGNELWIGAPGSDGAGRIYRAQPDKDGAWTAMSKLGVDTVEVGAQWAASFAVSGSNAIIGMPGDGGGGGTVAFMNKSATGAWGLRSLIMPPVPPRFAKVTGKEVKCEGGKAADFECGESALLSYMPISAIGGKRGVGLSGSWGWTDPVNGHDISIIGRTDGTAFVDVTDPVNPRYLGDLMRTKGANMSSWREIKTYKNYALIVSDGSGDHHGIQIFDLTKLRGVMTPRRFTEDAHFDAGSIHDIAVNEASGYAYALGTSSGGETCAGGSLMIDMKNPLKPAFAGCFADVGTGRSRGGYTHDIQCVMYKGPDTRYTGHEICMAANETTVSIQDVTDKKNVKVLSHADYPTVGYTHQGWFTEDQKYWYLNDELDESGNNGQGLGRAAEGTRTMIFDVSDLTQPVMVKEYIGPTHAIDHNLYIKGDRMYQSNYLAGLRILDISDPVNPKEIGHFDTTPGPITASFGGSWNNYPFFKNGAIGIVSMGEGFFMVKDVARKPKVMQ